MALVPGILALAVPAWGDAAVSPGQVPSADGIRVIARGTIIRTSPNKDRNEFALPPWDAVTVDLIFGFKEEPRRGEKVGVHPLNGLPPVELKILRSKRRNDFGSDWWEVDVEPVTERAYFDAGAQPGRRLDMPFDAVVLYPRSPNARILPAAVVDRSQLPKALALKTVTAILDVDGDQQPDIVTTDFCCGRPTVALSTGPKYCGYHCGATYRRQAGKWRKVDHWSPHD